MTDGGQDMYNLDLLGQDVSQGEITRDFDFSALSRWPEPEADNLQGSDATDELLLDTADILSALTRSNGQDELRIVTLNDGFGALSLPLQQFARGNSLNWTITAWNDSLSREQAISNNATQLGLPSPVATQLKLQEVVSGAVVILIQAPRSLSELRQLIEATALAASADVLVLVGGRQKYLTLSINDVLGEYFNEVRAGRARSKSRVIAATGKRPLPENYVSAFPVRSEPKTLAGIPLKLAAYGATFGGTNIDPGTRFFLETLKLTFGDSAEFPDSIVDLGCGNGTISSFFPLQFPKFSGRMLATDSSRDAVAATQETAILNNEADRVVAVRDDAMSTFPDKSEELILLNPPFHVGNTVDPNIALKLFRASARVLKNNGELWCVWNSHLNYKHDLNRIVGPTTEIAKNRKFTVTRSLKRA
ncbi:16S rRNA (guanine1207-N2)-methyltransferase [Neomicrococcus aestuarii]|uniref:16S rRNA (Guanine1207-N2)-methyltransferase n=1 Tax=Neomicrococcus aestuarii TaxID=556325 RepID=A0A7W8TRW6_9MICC|nr:methyltransferase [Neomicrococcus aestuarii]MBB5511796.1 16S rRNA (guanine1207-N2)-methyltransferase [Neomicrococcus aestuarii]